MTAGPPTYDPLIGEWMAGTTPLRDVSGTWYGGDNVDERRNPFRLGPSTARERRFRATTADVSAVGSPGTTECVSEVERTRQEEEGEHPEVDRAYDVDDGGQVPEKADTYDGPDPEDDPPGEADDEDQGI
jgi:hypothetical protein